MTETLQTASDISSFIHGNAVEFYGNAATAKRVMPALVSCMNEAVQTANKRLLGGEGFGSFLISAYRYFIPNADIELYHISTTFQTVWVSHFETWFQEYVKQLKTNPDGLGSTANLKLPGPKDAEDVVRATLDKISSTLLEWYLTSLDALASKEKDMQGGFCETPTREPVSTIPQTEWDEAWRAEFCGNVLDRLELKLHLNVSAVANDENKMFMSRIIPVVQASGTGKSRLAEEYVKNNFGIVLRLKNGENYPPANPRVYKYFRDLTSLPTRIEDLPGQDMVMTPRHLPDLSEEEQEKIYTKIYSENKYLTPESAVYENVFKTPKDYSVPKRWAAAGRLKVACFLVGFFETMIEYMSNKVYNSLTAWQTNFLYTQATKSGPLDKFWDTVLKKALETLSNKAELYKTWLRLSPANKKQRVTEEMEGAMNEEDFTSYPSNGEIKTELANLLREPIKAFFSHPVTKAFLRQISDKSKLPFLFIIDEAAFLFQTNYMHSFMWVLDQPVVHILTDVYQGDPDSYGLPQTPTDRFFILMLGTHSQISHFAPNEIFPSERLAGKPQLLASPFLSFNWDVNVKEFRPPFGLRDSEKLFELACWGRSMWGALFANRSTRISLYRCIEYIKTKLQPAREGERMHRELSILAVMSIRLHLDLDCAAPTRASQLVCSKMRWLADVGQFRRHITTTYGSEPLLVEAAACMMNSYDDTNSEDSPKSVRPFVSYISEMLDQLSKGYISRGNHGELTARLLLILAKDEATHRIWNADPNIGSRLSKKSRKHGSESPEESFEESSRYYRLHISPSEPYAFYHRAVPVKEFLKAFLHEDCWEYFRTFDNSEDGAPRWAKKWATLDNAYVNFTHFARVKDQPDGWAFTKFGIFHAWRRHVAYFMGAQFPCVDLFIPVAYANAENIITLDRLAFILISVKNHSRTTHDSLSQEDLKKEFVLGKPNEKGQYLKPTSKSNLILSLRTLPIIYRGDKSDLDNIPDGREWIEATEHNPYIAFSMSIGSGPTIEGKRRFVPELQTDENEERIVFALRGLHNTYNLHGAGRDLESIVKRHDNSGEYPLSALDFAEEFNMVKAGREPLEDLSKSLFRGFPSIASYSNLSTPTASTSATSTPSIPSRTNTPKSTNSLQSDTHESQIPEQIPETARKTRQVDPRPIAKPRKKLTKATK